MREKIKNELLKIEKDHEIKILYACESGSRAWGFPSPDSDWDVRFIYIHPENWYLSIDKRDDFLDFPINSELDINGWDITKSLKLFAGSNPVIFEWLQSPIIYHERNGFSQKLFSYSHDYYSLRKGLHHYLGMTAKAFQSIEGCEEIKLKKYFYALRALLSSLWIVNRRNLPPMEFHKLWEMIQNDKQLNLLINEMLEKKKKSVETEKIRPIEDINIFIKEKSEYCESQSAGFDKIDFDYQPLNIFFRELLKYENN